MRVYSDTTPLDVELSCRYNRVSTNTENLEFLKSLLEILEICILLLLLEKFITQSYT